MSALDEILVTAKTFTRECVCGEQTTAQVLVRVRRLDERRRVAGDSASVSRNYCDDCAAKLYIELAAKVRT